MNLDRPWLYPQNAGHLQFMKLVLASLSGGKTGVDAIHAANEVMDELDVVHNVPQEVPRQPRVAPYDGHGNTYQAFHRLPDGTTLLNGPMNNLIIRQNERSVEIQVADIADVLGAIRLSYYGQGPPPPPQPTRKPGSGRNRKP